MWDIRLLYKEKDNLDPSTDSLSVLSLGPTSIVRTIGSAPFLGGIGQVLTNIEGPVALEYPGVPSPTG
jgi:hypothetical protein